MISLPPQHGEKTEMQIHDDAAMKEADNESAVVRSLHDKLVEIVFYVKADTSEIERAPSRLVELAQGIGNVSIYVNDGGGLDEFDHADTFNREEGEEEEICQ
jgi:hypothetical protein